LFWLKSLAYLEFDDSGQLSAEIYDKRDFNSKIITFPNMCSNIPASPAYHMRLIVQQTAILLELKDVNSPYPDHVPEQCFLEGNNALTINMRSIKHIMHYDRNL
jgi:hypothetical protein